MNRKDYKKCPRCKAKVYKFNKICPNCDLHFDRINNLSNSEAKKALKKKEKEKVLYVTDMPKDINKKRFYLFYALLGWFGIHNLYIGKYKKGLYSLISVLLFAIMFAVGYILEDNGYDISALTYFIIAPLSTFAVFGILLWFIELPQLFTKTFTYPASLTQEDYINIIMKSKKIQEYAFELEKEKVNKQNQEKDTKETTNTEIENESVEKKTTTKKKTTGKKKHKMKRKK